jgi:hypothetical protein
MQNKPFLTVLACGLVLAFSGADEPAPDSPPAESPPVVVEIKPAPFAPGLKIGRFGKPVEIGSAEALKELNLDEQRQKKLQEQVNFDQQTLLVFAWSGSGQDRIQFESNDESPVEIVFTRKPGRTRDLRRHVRAFAIPKEAKWSVK